MVAKAKVKSEIEKAIAKCRSHLGDVVGFSIRLGPGGVEPEEFAKAFIREGLPSQWLPATIQKEPAFRRAINDAKRAHPSLSFTKLTDTPAQLSWGISEATDAHALGDVSSRLVNRVGFLRVDVGDNLGPGTTVADVEDDVFEYINSAYVHHQGHLDRSDVVAVIKRCLSQWRAVPLAGWGQFFVGPEHADPLRALAKVVSQLNESAFEVYALPKVSEAQSAIGSAAKLALSAEIEVLTERVELWISGERGYMPGSLAKKLEEAAKLRDRAVKLKALTKATTTDLEAQLDTLSTAVKGLIKNGAPVE